MHVYLYKDESTLWDHLLLILKSISKNQVLKILVGKIGVKFDVEQHNILV